MTIKNYARKVVSAVINTAMTNIRHVNCKFINLLNTCWERQCWGAVVGRSVGRGMCGGETKV